MKRVCKILLLWLTAVGCWGCEKTDLNAPDHTGTETVLLMNAGLSGLSVSATSRVTSNNWIQTHIGIGNIAIAIYDHATGERVYSAAKYPVKMISTGACYQQAWGLGNFTPDPAKTYDLAFVANFAKTAELHAFLNTASWADLTNPQPTSPTFQIPRSDMSAPTGVVISDYVEENQTVFAGKSAAMFGNMWRTPALSGTIRDIKLVRGGINVLGFKKIDDAYSPAVDLATINNDLNTSYTSLPELHDATEGETDNTKRTLTVGPCYAMVVVDNLINHTGGRLEITDIFMMNVPMYHHLFADATYYFGKTQASIAEVEDIGVALFSTGKDLVSGFEPTWIDSAFEEACEHDDFARLMHYPAGQTVDLANFKRQYLAEESNDLAKSNYYFKLPQTGQMFDRLSVSTSNANDNFMKCFSGSDGKTTGYWNFLCDKLLVSLTTDFTTSVVRKAPFFLVSQNDGLYPNELTTDEHGNRQYLYATRLVIRGTWKETPESPGEVVYYPIIVNGPNQGFMAEYDDDSQEKVNNFVKNGRRYIYSITLESKGIRNPWMASRVAVTLGTIQLKVDTWSEALLDIPKYIY